MRLIDRDELFKERMPIHEGDAAARLREVLRRIQNAPVVDAVEVVRCKDCKHSGYCEMESLMREVDKISDPYCAAGKRREENAAD